MKKLQNAPIRMRKDAKYIVTAGIMAILLAVSCYFAFSFGLMREEADYFRMIIAVIGMLFAAILFVSCCVSNRDHTRQGNRLAAISALLYFNILLSGVTDVLDGIDGMGSLLFTFQTLTAVILTIVHYLFWRYQCASLPDISIRRYFSAIIQGLILIYIILLVINPFTNILFAVDASEHLISTGQVLDLIIVFSFYLIYLLYILPQRCSKKKKLSLASFVVFPMLCIAFTAIWYATGIPYVVSSITFIFMLMAAYVVFFCDYIENKELLLLRNAELAQHEKKQTEMQTALMLSQIRPHFLYNALTAIRYLCRKNPVEAYTALGWFSEYLRGNMDALSNGRMISFEKELEHIRTYLLLEQMRFGDELKVEYDIQYQDFSLPTLTAQPIVENAVRHGATMNEKGGRITIRSEKTEDGAVITVTDNGLGFDPAAPMTEGRNHFGLENVRGCLVATGCGDLRIESVPGKGTTVTIIIWEGNE